MRRYHRYAEAVAEAVAEAGAWLQGSQGVGSQVVADEP